MWMVKLRWHGLSFHCCGRTHSAFGVVRYAAPRQQTFFNSDIPVCSVICPIRVLPQRWRSSSLLHEFVMAVVNDVKSIESPTLNGPVYQELLSFRRAHRCGDGRGSSRGEGIRFRMPPGINPRGFCASPRRRFPISPTESHSKTLNEAAYPIPEFFVVRRNWPQFRHASFLLLTAAVPADHGDLDQDALPARHHAE